MADRPTKGAFQADIPADAVEEALRSVERVSHGDDAPVPEGTELSAELVSAGDPEGSESEREKSLSAQLELSQEKARETLERLKDIHDRHVRAVADLENFKKRAQRERDDILRYGNEKLLKDIFPVVDALDRALASAPPDDPMVKGVRLTLSTLEQALARHGVKSFSALGQAFDPGLHEALLQVPTADEKPGTVVVEHARGFLLNERLARAAMVGVAVAPPQGGPPPAGAAAGPKTPGDGGEG